MAEAQEVGSGGPGATCVSTINALRRRKLVNINQPLRVVWGRAVSSDDLDEELCTFLNIDPNETRAPAIATSTKISKKRRATINSIETPSFSIMKDYDVWMRQHHPELCCGEDGKSVGYIRYRPPVDETVDEYVVDDEDEAWLAKLNRKADCKLDDKVFETAMGVLEHKFHQAVVRYLASHSNSNRDFLSGCTAADVLQLPKARHIIQWEDVSAALREAGVQEGHSKPLFLYWRRRREALDRPMLQQLWFEMPWKVMLESRQDVPAHAEDEVPFQCQQDNALPRVARGLTAEELYERLTTVRAELDVVRTLTDQVRRREKWKRRLIAVQHQLWQEQFNNPQDALRYYSKCLRRKNKGNLSYCSCVNGGPKCPFCAAVSSFNSLKPSAAAKSKNGVKRSTAGKDGQPQCEPSKSKEEAAAACSAEHAAADIASPSDVVAHNGAYVPQHSTRLTAKAKSARRHSAPGRQTTADHHVANKENCGASIGNVGKQTGAAGPSTRQSHGPPSHVSHKADDVHASVAVSNSSRTQKRSPTLRMRKHAVDGSQEPAAAAGTASTLKTESHAHEQRCLRGKRTVDGDAAPSCSHHTHRRRDDVHAAADTSVDTPLHSTRAKAVRLVSPDATSEGEQRHRNGRVRQKLQARDMTLRSGLQVKRRFAAQPSQKRAVPRAVPHKWGVHAAVMRKRGSAKFCARPSALGRFRHRRNGHAATPV